MNLKSPGIKPRNLPGRSHPPGPLPSVGVGERLFPSGSRLTEDGEETPRTPLTVSAPHTPPHNVATTSADFSIFAQIMIGQGKHFPSLILDCSYCFNSNNTGIVRIYQNKT